MGVSYRALCAELTDKLEACSGPKEPMVVKARQLLAMPDPSRYKRGEENIAAILTPELVRKMRRLRVEGWSYRQLASEFDVDEKHAWRICKRVAWAWLDD